MRSPLLFLLLATTLITGAAAAAQAQTKITFRIDMRPQFKDSTFNPDRHRIELTGNQLPFSKTRTIELTDQPPIDSIYVTTLNFPSLTNGNVLRYNYIITGDTEKRTENRPRLLPLNRQKEELPLMLFNVISE